MSCWTVSRRTRSGVIEVLPLAQKASGWLCTEGDQVVIDALTESLPTLRMAGQAIMPKSLTRAGCGYHACFELLIETWAGFTRLEAGDGTERRAIVLEVRPHQHKLGGTSFDDMLAELSKRSAGLVWGLSPGGVPGSLAAGALSVVHPAVLASQLPRFLGLVHTYVSAPPTSTVRLTRPRTLDLARRTDVATLRRLGRRPALLRALQGDGSAGKFADPRQPIEQSEVIASLDHPMTRYLAHLLRRLAQRFHLSAASLRNAKGRPFPDAAMEANAAHLADAMVSGALQMESLLRKPLLRSVRPEQLDGSALQSLADQPIFGALHRIGRRLLDPGLAYGPDSSIESALKHTYDLFEIFVLFRLVEGLPGVLGPTWSMRPHRFRHSEMREERPLNRAAWWFDGPDGLTIELRYQQWFSRIRSFPDGRMFSSLSGVGIPDYILVARRGLRPIGWVILDAKYRSAPNAVDDGLADVHRYRDALRVRGMRASGSFVIVPQLRELGAPYASTEFLHHHAFGALRLFDNDWLCPVARLLASDCAKPSAPNEVPAK